MDRLRITTLRRARWVMFIVVFGIVFGMTPTAGATGPVPTATPGIKTCAEPPEPASPGAGLPGKIYPRPASASTGDPFAEGSTVTIADVYGYSYRWQDYDNGCLPSEVTHANTAVSNFLFSGAAFVNALTHQEFTFVISPNWLKPFDAALIKATQAVQRGFFGPWFTPVLLLVAAGVLWAAMRADISSAITSVGWAMLVLVATTYVMSFPVASAELVDGLVKESVTTAARGTITPPAPYAADKAVPEDEDSPFTKPVPDEVSHAQRAMNAQMDVINRNTLYSAWLEGTLGSSTSATATTYGPDLFKASHLSWAEYATVQSDPVAGQAIIDAKKNTWVSTAAKVKSGDPSAYQYLTGNNGRFEAAFIVWLNVITTMPFLIFAGVLVVVSFIAIRGLIPLVPALGVFGMFRPLQGWLLGVVGRVGKVIALGPLFFAGSLVNFMLVTAVFGTDLAYALKLTLVAMIPLILFAILKPRKNGGLGKMWRQARGLVLRVGKKSGPGGNGTGDGKGGGGGGDGRKDRSGRGDERTGRTNPDHDTDNDREGGGRSPVFIPTRTDDQDDEPSRPRRPSPAVTSRHPRQDRRPERAPDDHAHDGADRSGWEPGSRSHEPVMPDSDRPRRPRTGPSPTSVDGTDLSAPATNYRPGLVADDPDDNPDDDEPFVPWTPPGYTPTRTREKV